MPPNFIGFIDGTVRSVCRPVACQEAVYSGHKRVHALKFQGVMLPNGLIGSFSGPYPGAWHDARMLNASRLKNQLDQFAPGYLLYGDGAYPWGKHFRRPFRCPPSGSVQVCTRLR